MTFQIKDITLYKSGVGFFNGECKEKEFILPVNEDVVDDILKSISIDSLKFVTFSASENKNDMQKKIGIKIDSVKAFLSFGQHLIGLAVEIDTLEQRYAGTVIGIDYILLEKINDSEKGLDVLVLKTAETVKHIPISKIGTLKILDPTIKKDLEVFLNLEAITRKTGVTNLKIYTEKDNAKLQWVSPVSAWRLSYRVMFDEQSKKANFVGLAIVDNTTSIDWENIKLRLVTGKPVSFKYDLHTPLYVDRPWIARDETGTSPIIAQTALRPSVTPQKRDEGIISHVTDTSRFGRSTTIKLTEETDWDISRDVIASEKKTSTEELGATVTYEVIKPITINRSESSLIPLIAQAYLGDQCVVVRDDRIDEAMDALLFRKTLDLEKGVATIYIDEIFAGETMIVRGSDYIAYRVNQNVKLLKEIKEENKITSVSISQNILLQKHTNIKTYTFKILNISDKTLTLVLEIGKIDGYTPENKPVKESANYNRYILDIEPGTIEKTFAFEQSFSESYYIRNLSDEFVQQLIKDGILSAKDQRIIMQIFENMKKLTQKEKEKKDLENEIKFVFTDQERLRENIKTLQRIKQESERDEYIQKLKDSEQLLENLERENKSLNTEIGKLKEKI
ncbi:MAG: DUF4139 domain-containing protein [Candidatus Heimdallarchaeota archaeon]|nr:DUF4139 domain-containing protein [Candidatus Heimdallarchaeota archaeon]